MSRMDSNDYQVNLYKSKKLASGLDKQDIKYANRDYVLSFLEHQPGLSRIQLAKLTGMSPTSMTRIMDELMSLDLIQEIEGEYSGVGRRSVQLALNPDAFHVLGLTISECTFSFCIANYCGEILFKKTYSHDLKPGIAQEELVDCCYHTYQTFLSDYLMQTPDYPTTLIKVMGVSFPGTVSSESKIVLSCPCFGWGKNIDFLNNLESRFQLCLVVENDIKASLINEYYRHPKHQSDTMAFLSLDYGIGVAFMQNGVLLKGIHSGAGEIAHIIIPKQSQRDELQTEPEKSFYSSRLCYEELLHEANASGLKVENIVELSGLYKTGDALAVVYCESVSHYLASLLNVIICLYNPEKIILGGITLHEFPELIDLALKHQDFFYQDIADGIQIELTYEKEDEALFGSTVLATKFYRNHLLHKQFYGRES